MERTALLRSEHHAALVYRRRSAATEAAQGVSDKPEMNYSDGKAAKAQIFPVPPPIL